MTFRIGLGSDLHRLKPGDGIRLGGVDIPCPYACEAVSDGDVLLHALIDALLGALGLGDIGVYFPPSAVRPGEDSRILLQTILALPRVRRAAIVNVDAIIDLERPKLGPSKKIIAAALAELLAIPPSRVNVKGKTGEGLGPVGEGRAVAAQVALLLELDASDAEGDDA